MRGRTRTNLTVVLILAAIGVSSASAIPPSFAGSADRYAFATVQAGDLSGLVLNLDLHQTLNSDPGYNSSTLQYSCSTIVSASKKEEVWGCGTLAATYDPALQSVVIKGKLGGDVYDISKTPGKFVKHATQTLNVTFTANGTPTAGLPPAPQTCVLSQDKNNDAASYYALAGAGISQKEKASGSVATALGTLSYASSKTAVAALGALSTWSDAVQFPSGIGEPKGCPA